MTKVNCLSASAFLGMLIGTLYAVEAPALSQAIVMRAVAVMLLSSVFVFALASGTRFLPSAIRIGTIGAMALVAGCGIVQKTGSLSRAAETPQIAAVVTDVSSSDVMRHSDGHFRAVAQIGEQPVDVLVDTGASVVLLKFEDAVAAGVDMASLRFNVPVLTANGRSHVATFNIDRISVGSVEVKNIRGAVAEPGQLHASLLGMSFLGAIEEAVIRKDRLILRN